MAANDSKSTTSTSNTEDTTNTTAVASTDSAAGAKAGLSEGEVKALRDDAGMNALPGSEPNVLAWEQTDAGKQFLKEEKERVKKDEAAAKATAESLTKDGYTEAEKKYREALSK